MISRSNLRTGAAVMVGNGLIAVLGVGALRLYTELAPASLFGTANLALGALALGIQIFVLPVSSTQLRYHTEALRAGRGDAFTAQMMQWALASSAILGLLAVIAFGFGLVPGIATASFALAFAALLWAGVSTARTMLLGRLHAEQRMMAYMGVRVLEAVLTIAATCGLIVWLKRPEAFVWGQVAAIAVAIAAATLVAPSHLLRHIDLNRMSQEWPRLWAYGAPFVPLALLTWAANLSDRYVLGASVNAAVVGHYLAAFAIASNGFTLTNAAMGDLFRPRLFDAQNANDHARAHRIFLTWMAGYVAISLLGILIIVFAGQWVVDIVLARQYRAGAVPIMIWIGFGFAISGCTIALQNRMFSLGHSARVIWPLAVGAAGNLLFSLVLVRRNGAIGAAEANCAGFALQFLMTAISLRRVLKEQR